MKEDSKKVNEKVTEVYNKIENLICQLNLNISNYYNELYQANLLDEFYDFINNNDNDITRVIKEINKVEI